MMKYRLSAIALLAAFASGLGSAAPLPEYLKNPKGDFVVLDTAAGPIKIRLFPDKAPITVKNFLGYVDGRFYDGMIFHRVIPNFMIQGGGFDADFTEKKGREPIKNEGANGLSNRRGTLAVARTVNPDSGTCQFFINLKDNAFLDQTQARDMAGYCVFGEVIDGMNVVDQIAKVATGDQKGHSNVPLQPVLIRTARRSP